MDICIPYRMGPRNGVELKYTLRSLERNLIDLGDGECFLIGNEAPDWYRGGLVTLTENNKLSNISKVIAKVHHFVTHYAGPSFCFANDDTFILRPWSGIRYWNKRRVACGYHHTTVSRAQFVLQQRGLKFAHDYELHVPLIVHTRQAKELLDETKYDAPIALRTLYCNTYPEVEFGIPDVKIATFVRPTGNQQFLSTDDAFLHLPDLHKFWAEKWPHPSRWEKP